MYFILYSLSGQGLILFIVNFVKFDFDVEISEEWSTFIRKWFIFSRFNDMIHTVLAKIYENEWFCQEKRLKEKCGLYESTETVKLAN
jgi:hypothetical protein